MRRRLAFPGPISHKPGVNATIEPHPFPDYAEARRKMVDNQLRTFDVTDRAVLAAAAAVPREAFMPPGRAALAYLDRNLECGDGDDRRVLLQPMILARIVQGLAVRPGETVLDVAGGLGYSAALLASLGAEVTALEASDDLAGAMSDRLRDVALGREVSVRVGALADGWPDGAPFDAILINGAVETRPETLLRQLTPGGRLACIQRSGTSSSAILYVRSGDAIGLRPLFDAVAPVISAFQDKPAFRF